jgi:L,D-transpeptidase YcbB
MSGLRVDRLPTWAAVVFLIAGVAGAGTAWPRPSPMILAPPVLGEANQPRIEVELLGPAFKGKNSGEQTVIASEITDGSANQRATAVQDDIAQVAEQPAPPRLTAPAEGDEVPTPNTIAPVTTDSPTAIPQPVTSSEGDEVPAPLVIIPAATETQRPEMQPAAASGGNDIATPTPAQIVDANAPIADRLRELATGKFDRAIGGMRERSAFEAFYSGRNYAPVWITEGKVNARAKAAIAYLGQVDADGLDPTDYPVPNFTSLADPAALAEAEVRLTASVVTYAHHAQMGRVHWTRVSGDIFYDRKAPELADVLSEMVSAVDVGEALAGYEPQHPAYLALKAKLAELRAGNGIAGKTPIPNGPLLKIGVKDDRVPQLRERLDIPSDGGSTYDRALSEAVKKFQQQHKLAATGTLTAATIEALNGRQPERSTDIIIANMERWRWMPHDLGKTYVIVNLPEFMLRVVTGGKPVWMTKVVDGKPETPTPIISAEMKSITINPTWNIPDSIAANEYMPLLRQDSTVLERMGLNVRRNPDNTIHISQPPGPNNALGQLRFNFPNKFLVYQHDSNQKYLFANPTRDNSHGCMRVEDPVKYAEVLLGMARPREGYTEQRIRSMFGDNEIEIRLPAFIPVHLTYQTAFVDEKGKLQVREDIYGRDKALLAILKGDERKVADIPIERKDNAVRREALAIPDQAWGGGGQNLFTRLFGSFAPQPTPAPRRPVAQH